MMPMSWFIQTPTGTLIWNETSQDAHSSHLMISHRAYLHIAAFCDITPVNTRITMNKCYIVQCESTEMLFSLVHDKRSLFIHNSFILRVTLDSKLEWSQRSLIHLKEWFWEYVGNQELGGTHRESMPLHTDSQDQTRNPGAVKWQPAAFTSAFNRVRTAGWNFVMMQEVPAILIHVNVSVIQSTVRLKL